MFTCTCHYPRTIPAAFLPFNHYYCKATAIVQQFISDNTPHSLSERDGRTIINLPREMLNGAAMPNSLWTKIAAKIIGKYADLSFLRDVGTRPHGGRQAQRTLTCDIPDFHITYSCKSNFEFTGFRDAPYGTGNPESLYQRACTSSLKGRPRQHPHHLRQQGGFASNNSGAGQLHYY